MDLFFRKIAAASRPLSESVLTSSKILIGLDAILAALTVLANGTFLITLVRKHSLHTSSNILLGALCVSDLLVGLVLQPTWMADLFMRINRQFSFHLVQLKVILMLFLVGLSFDYIALISFERYSAICHRSSMLNMQLKGKRSQLLA